MWWGEGRISSFSLLEMPFLMQPKRQLVLAIRAHCCLKLMQGLPGPSRSSYTKLLSNQLAPSFMVVSMLCLLSAGGRQCIIFLGSLGTGISQKEVFVNESLWREAVHCTDVYMMPAFKGISNNLLNLLLHKHLIMQNFTILTVSTVKFVVCCMHIYLLFSDSAVIINCNGYTLNNIQDFQER